MSDFKIIIKTKNLQIEEIPEILDQIKESYQQGFVRGGGEKEKDKEYQFDTIFEE